MLTDLFEQIEDSRLTTAFLLASDVDWLYRKIAALEPVQVLLGIVRKNPAAIQELTDRTLTLVRMPVELERLSDYETPICCYAYVLSHVNDQAARELMDYLDANAGRAYGWLRHLMSRFLWGATTSTYFERESGVPGRSTVSFESPSTSTLGDFGVKLADLTSFESISEDWAPELIPA